MKPIILFTALFFLAVCVQAQETPEPPKPPTPVHMNTNSSSSSSYQHTVTNSEQQDANLSVAVSDSDGRYKFRASYSDSYDVQVKEILVSEFGKENISKRGSWFSWVFSPGENEVYSIELSSGKLRMKLNKTQTDDELEQKFIRTGETIKQMLSGEKVN